MKTVLYLTLGLLVSAFVLAQFGLLSGSRPADIGIKEARLKPPSPTRNSVSSQAMLYPEHPQRSYAEIKPFPLKNGSAAESLAALITTLQAMPNITVVAHQPDYVYAQAQTPWLKFVDELEFWFNPTLSVLEVRSASRLGREDFGVNRQRIEAIRAAYLAQP